MFPKPLVIRTKLAPPRLNRRVLARERVNARLLEALDYRLTVVQAGAGYGKSTALAALAGRPLPLAWYHIETEDAEPLIFLLHLVSACQRAWPGIGDDILAELEHWETGPGMGSWMWVIEQLANELAERLEAPALLVLDDAHRLNDAPEPLKLVDRLLECAPPDLHVLASTRYPLRLGGLVNLKARGELLEIDQEELAFTRTEAAALFRSPYGLPLSPEQLDELYASTEGWIIALQLYWQGLKSGALRLGQGSAPAAAQADNLFPYLAQEVLARQPEDVQAFLMETAVLRELVPDLCDDLRGANDSRRYLEYLSENSLFVLELEDRNLRYHTLFRRFLLSRMPAERLREMHTRAGQCCLAAGYPSDAVDHFIGAGLLEQAAEILDREGSAMVRAGRLDSLQKWIAAMPPEMLARHPLLMARLGDIGRLRSRFGEALSWYQQSEEYSRQAGYVHGVSQALRGQARVYLDTVNASQAETLLEQVLHLTDGQEDRDSRARLLELMAENRLNLGHPDEAERYQQQAQEIREAGPSESHLAVRVRLRTGKLGEARQLLEERHALEQREKNVQPPRSHRETSLLLALVLAFQGEGDLAYNYARQGVARGQQLQAPFITAVGYMRQGHARLVQADENSYTDACRLYEQAVRLSEDLSVPRLRVEALWGLCRAHGLSGDLAAAASAASRGVQKAERAGDEWIKGLICVSLGAGLVEHNQLDKALTWLDQAEGAFRGCADSFGQTVTLLWQSLLLKRRQDDARLERSLRELLASVQANDYPYLFLRRTLLGPSDPRSLVPLLLYARDRDIRREDAIGLLRQLGLEGLETHPGYQLRAQTLGAFRLWRGAEEVSGSEWRREKARQLFQLLTASRGRPMDREMITETLWPGLEPEAAQRDFKVALNTLLRVLEPERGKDEPSAFVLRDGRLYSLRADADFWLDAAEFEGRIEQGDRIWKDHPEEASEHYRAALPLYKGEFFAEYPYEDWLAPERERLLALYLRTADRVARCLAAAENWPELIDLCQAILQHDNCWEEAYRLQMQAYDRLGNRAQALRAFRRCEQTLAAELGAQPGEAVQELWQRLRQGSD